MGGGQSSVGHSPSSGSGAGGGWRAVPSNVERNRGRGSTPLLAASGVVTHGHHLATAEGTPAQLAWSPDVFAWLSQPTNPKILT